VLGDPAPPRALIASVRSRARDRAFFRARAAGAWLVRRSPIRQRSLRNVEPPVFAADGGGVRCHLYPATQAAPHERPRIEPLIRVRPARVRSLRYLNRQKIGGGQVDVDRHLPGKSSAASARQFRNRRSAA
jgi:hypothetical protein